jgi:adenylate cyclase
MGIDFEAEGLLDGLDDDREREARLDLLRQLEEKGVELDELKQAVADGRLALLPVERVLMGEGRRYTSTEIAEEAGMDREFLDKVWRALGLALSDPDEPAYGEYDLEGAKQVKRFRDAGMPEDGILEISRVMGHGMASLAASIGDVFGEAFIEAGDTERDVGIRYAEASRELVPLLGSTLEHVLRIHQREFVRQAAVFVEERATGRLVDAQEVTVGFADLVDFTKLGERIPPHELGAVAGRLGDLTSDVVEPPVRLVKTIGDGVMIVSRDSDCLVRAALDLVTAAEAEGEEFPDLRAGVAHGPALTRSGDWYGRPVNLASRITDFARPRSVVAEKAVREQVDGDYRWSPAGKRKLKGIKGEVSLFRVRSPETDSDDED